jgi:predicted exporter
MTSARTRIFLLWLLFLAVCLGALARTTFTADMSAFLPSHPTPEQQILVDQLKGGTVSRLLLAGIEGAEPPQLATLSRSLATRLGARAEFASVRNGDDRNLERDRALLFQHRYLLSPAVTAERFSVAGLKAAVGESIDLLASPAGLMTKNLLPRDPTGEMLEMISSVEGNAGPARQHGVWMAPHGKRALMLVQTAAAGSDTDAQEAALALLRSEFATVSHEAGLPDARLVVSGTGVFSVNARATIHHEVTRLAIASSSAIVLLLFAVYRSAATLAIGLLPVVTGALAGVAAVAIGFGTVHGLTIGFGTTLIGEAIDYSIYYFVQSQGNHGAMGNEGRRWIERFWPTIRLGVLTSIVGFSALVFSGFPGLAQLGVYSIAGLIAAAATTRYVLPQMRRGVVRAQFIPAFGQALAALGGWRGARLAAVALALGAAAILATHRDRLWNADLAALSPISAADRTLDLSLRKDLGLPDRPLLVVLGAPDRESALRAAESAGVQLQSLVAAGKLAGFDSPARFQPSALTQQARRDALPDRPTLTARLARALEGLPLRSERLTPFIDDVEAARRQPLLTEDDLKGSSLALAVESMLLPHGDGWRVVLPVAEVQTPDAAATPDRGPLRAALAAAGQADALIVELGEEARSLYATYLSEAITLSLLGFAALVLLLTVALRSPRRLFRVLAPLVLSVLLVTAGLALAGEQLLLLHLVGLLLIVAVGSNYALFFDRSAAGGGIEHHALGSLMLANLTAVIGFGTLAFSNVPVLHALGITVGPGAILALVLSAALARREQTT